MCGFAGVINNTFAIHRNQIAAIAEKVAYRGPDSCSVKVYDDSMNEGDEGCHALFFNRLAIIDLDQRSDQPFEDDRYSLVFNGEIYNYQSIKQELAEKGYVFHTTSDTEVLFNALKCWGSDAVPKLNGMFAFFFMDRLQKTFLVARDRVGIKPLFYSQTGQSLIFSSELHSILRLSPNKPIINTGTFQMYLWMQFIPSPFTPFQNIYKLPPGHFMQGSLGELNQEVVLQPKCFWDAYDERLKKEEGRSKDLESILVETLRRQIVADVPLGLFLSSGVDSSLLAALIHKHFAKEQSFNFFTVSFSEQTASDESTDALHFIKGFNNRNLKADSLPINSAFIGKHLDSLYDYVDEPFGDPAVLLNWAISRKAKEHVSVALSGDGADELFWGYARYKNWQRRLLQLPGNIKLEGNALAFISHFIPISFYRSLAANVSEKDPVKRHFNLFLHPAFSQLKENPVYNQNIWAMKGITKISTTEDLAGVLDLKTYLPDAMLYKVDRSSMAASLEVRVPYLDNMVVDYALDLPFQSKSNPVYDQKAPLKMLLRQIAPHYNANKPKKGFSFPLDQWLRNDWKERALSLFSLHELESMGLDGKNYMRLVTDYYNGTKRNNLAVWYLVNLLLWRESCERIAPLKNETISCSHH